MFFFLFLGVCEEKEILAKDARVIPDYYIPSLGDFALLKS
jgi:hypothetical protein